MTLVPWGRGHRQGRKKPGAHTHLRVDVVQGVDASILRERNMHQPLGLPAPPRPEPTWNPALSPSVTTESGERCFVPTVALFSAPRPSHSVIPIAVPSCCSPQRSSVCRVQLLVLFVSFSIIKAVGIYGALPMAEPSCEAGRWLLSLSCSLHGGGD